MSRPCPVCGRTWDLGATFCGACGAALDPRRAASTTVGRGRRTAVVVVVLAVTAVVAALVGLTVADDPGGSADGGGDVALPDDRAPGRATPEGDVACTHDGVPVDCVLWDAPVAPDTSLGPQLPGSPLLASVRDGGIVLRDPDTGQVRWERDDLGPAVVLAHVDDVLVLATRSDRVLGLDVRDGATLWSMSEVRPLGPPPRLDEPLVVVGRPDLGGGSPVLVAIDATTGVAAWEWTAPWEGDALRVAAGAAELDAVLVAGDGHLARIDPTTGTTDWRTRTLEGAYLTPHASTHVSAQQLGEAPSSQLWIHDARTGEVVRRLPADGLTTHVVADGVLVVHRPAESVVQARDLATDEVLWTVEHEGRAALGVGADPGVAGPRSLVLLDRASREVSRLDVATGEEVWRARLPATPVVRDASPYLGQPAVVGDVVVVEDPSSVVTVLDLATGQQRVRVDGGPGVDVRSLDPLVLRRGDRWLRIDVSPDP